MPHHAFRDINGYWSDSLETKCSLPKDESLSTLRTVLTGLNNKYIVELLNDKRNSVLRSYVISSDCTLDFPYLSKGQYCLRITEDANRNSITDSGSLFEHRQPEKVKFYEVDGKQFISIPESVEISQSIDLGEMFK